MLPIDQPGKVQSFDQACHQNSSMKKVFFAGGGNVLKSSGVASFH
jgi:hypothetical protein